jgi:hypothetical protein
MPEMAFMPQVVARILPSAFSASVRQPGTYGLAGESGVTLAPREMNGCRAAEAGNGGGLALTSETAAAQSG